MKQHETLNRYKIGTKDAEHFRPAPEYVRTSRLEFSLDDDPMRSTRCIDGITRPRYLCVEKEDGWHYRGYMQE